MTTFAETYIKPQRLKIPLYTGIKTCKTLAYLTETNVIGETNDIFQ